MTEPTNKELLDELGVQPASKKQAKLTPLQAKFSSKQKLGWHLAWPSALKEKTICGFATRSLPMFSKKPSCGSSHFFQSDTWKLETKT